MSIVKSEILKQLANNFPTYLRADLSKCLDLIFNEIIDSLARNQRCEIRSFGSFEIRQQKERWGRNPKSGKKILIPFKKKVYWKMSKELLKKLNQDTKHDE